MRRGVRKRIVIWSLTHRGNALDDTGQLIKDRLSSNVVLIDRITTGDSVESVIRVVLAGLPLRLG